MARVEDTRGKPEDVAVSNFREYLRIQTVHPEPDYGELFPPFLSFDFTDVCILSSCELWRCTLFTLLIRAARAVCYRLEDASL